VIEAPPPLEGDPRHVQLAVGRERWPGTWLSETACPLRHHGRAHGLFFDALYQVQDPRGATFLDWASGGHAALPVPVWTQVRQRATRIEWVDAVLLVAYEVDVATAGLNGREQDGNWLIAFQALRATGRGVELRFDPREHGALCHLCAMGPLGPREVHGRIHPSCWQPVGPEIRPGAKAIAVAEAPGYDEVRRGVPLVGKSGQELDARLAEAGWPREAVARVNVVQCQPPGNDWEAMERRLRGVNRGLDQAKKAWRRAGKLGEEPPEPWLHPKDACRPLLVKTITPFRDIVALGGKAASAVLGGRSTILDIRGGFREVPVLDAVGTPIEVDGEPFVRRVMPTLHPAFVLREPSKRRLFRPDIDRAVRWFTGRLRWQEPWMDLFPSVESLARFLAQPGVKRWAYDTETGPPAVERDRFGDQKAWAALGKEPMRADMRCLTVACRTTAACPLCGGSGRVVERDYERFQVYLSHCVRDSESRHERFSRVIDTMTAAMHEGRCRCCLGRGYGESRRAVLIPCLSIDGETRFYPRETKRALLDQTARAFRDPRRLWISQNGRVFDRLLVRRPEHVGAEPLVEVDIMPAERLEWIEGRHSLGETGSRMTDAPAWKADNDGKKIAVENKDDMRLHVYACTDGAVTDDCVEPVIAGIRAREQDHAIRSDLRPREWPAAFAWDLLGVDNFAMDVARGLRLNGQLVDHVERERLSRELVEEHRVWVGKVREIAHAHGVQGKAVSKKRGGGHEDFNPNSRPQLITLLHDVWGLPVRELTPAGERSTRDEVIRAHLADPSLGVEQQEFLYAVRMARRMVKAKSTFVDVAAWEGTPPEMAEEDPEAQEEEDVAEGGRCWRSDGRVHWDWQSALTAPGRMVAGVGVTLPKRYRAMFVAGPGRYLLGPDYDQLHLRIIANHWKIPALLEAFTEGIDPHNRMALAIFGDSFRHASGWGPEGFSLKRKPEGGLAKKMRDLAKIVRYAGAYWAAPDTIWNVITKSEDPDTHKLLHLDKTVAEVEGMVAKWMHDEPEWEQVWKARWRPWQEWERQGREWGSDGAPHAEEPLFGRRNHYLDGPTRSDPINWEILAAEPCLLRIAEARVIDRWPFGYAGAGTGVVNQCHDQLLMELEAPRGFDARAWVEAAKRAKKERAKPPELPPEIRRDIGELEERMLIRVPGWPVPITATADAGYRWSDV